MAEDREVLERLCRRQGIDVAYDDVWGHRHAVADAHLAQLLAAFDVAATEPSARADADRAADAAAWREALPPVVAIAAADPAWSVPIRLGEPAPASLRWTVTEEGGAEHAGTVDLAGVDVTAEAEVDGSVRRERRIAIQVALPAGYHRLRMGGVDGETLVVAAPAACWRPDFLAGGGRIWGPAIQLYALRSEGNWGIGDFGDLARVVEQWAARGAAIVGVNPLHALFAHNPAHASPYSPSSRQRLNPLCIDVEAVEDLRDCAAAQRLLRSVDFQDRLERLRASETVDYIGVAAAKAEVLRLLYAHFRARHLAAAGSERAAAFRDFQSRSGEALRLHALFETLQGRFHDEDPAVWGWPVWPPGWQDPRSPAVREFAAAHLDEVEFHEYLQWQAERQLARAAEHGRARGMAVGLYLDLAVSVDRAGSDTWSNASTYALGVSVGAPPDEFNQQGQAWGLPPLRPDRLRASGYRLFIETLRANMRHAGAVRIDHVMGLMRLFWIPDGLSGRDGAYVHYRADELLAIVALESQRNRCMVIGEDLGTVADEMRKALAARGVLSYRLLYFERGRDGAFLAPDAYRRDALVAVSTHDLPTLAGWWAGSDLALRDGLGLFPDGAAFLAQRDGRALDRDRLVEALAQARLLDSRDDVDRSRPLAPEVVDRVHAFLARTPSAVMVIQLEDALGTAEQANLPGTTDQHPNWRRKLAVDLDEIGASARIDRLAATIARLRPGPPGTPRPLPPVQAPIPRATYRVQLHKDFTFDDAAAMLPYLARLGVSHLYTSPISRARAGSLHGYDVVGHDEINPELGGEAGFARLTAALRENGLGLLLDLVPNHMGVFGADNAWWSDVLENGPASPYAQHFDIDWHPLDADLEGKVLLPVLGDHYGNVLASGELEPVFEAASGTFVVRYHEHRFPLDVRGYGDLLGRVGAADDASREPLAALARDFAGLEARDRVAPEQVASRAATKSCLQSALARLVHERPSLAGAIAEMLAGLRDPEALHALLESQAWRLAFWRVATDEINYRRFFDINSLAALRIEHRPVFEATQAMALELTAAGVVEGLRIDHPDGLRDPAQYFRRLQRGHARRAGRVLPETPGARPARPLYVVAEKIAALEEGLPDDWAVHGTTGYRFAALVNGVFVDTAAAAKFDRIWRGFTGDTDPFEEHAYEGKRAIMRGSLSSELTVLASELLRIARADRRTRDHTFNALRQALAEITACLPVYRTYIVDAPSAQDRQYIEGAVARAERRSRGADTSVFAFVGRTLLGQVVDGASDALRERARRWAVRYQQFSSPVAAKGVEDTAFYRYTRLASLNEVGGDPARFGVTVRAFHDASADRAAHRPHTMLAASTHDHKRSADVRCRIDVLSEMPAGWRLLLRRWSRMNRPHRSASADGVSSPSAIDEYLLYQTLLGTLPTAGFADDAALAAYRERIQAYMQKAVREAKLQSSWISPDEGYEAALTGFIDGLLGRRDDNAFLDDLSAQATRVAWFGRLNSLGTALVQFTSPGVPDIYQGHETISLTLVDPDNRQPVDYAARERALAALESLAPARAGELVDGPDEGAAKLWIAWRVLAWRRERPLLFRDGRYLPLRASGAAAAHVLAFARTHAGATLVVVATRLPARLLGDPGRLPVGEAVWGDTAVALELPEGTRLRNLLTDETVSVGRGGRIAIAAALRSFPGAALASD